MIPLPDVEHPSSLGRDNDTSQIVDFAGDS